MAQTFSPDTVLLSETLGKEITSEYITDLFTDELIKTSKLIQLGQKVEMDGKMVRKGVELGQLTDAYFVGEGQKSVLQKYKLNLTFWKLVKSQLSFQ